VNFADFSLRSFANNSAMLVSVGSGRLRDAHVTHLAV